MKMQTSNIRDILIELGYSINSESATHYKTNASYRGGDNPTALSINKTTGWFTDFSSGRTGSIQDLIRLSSGHDIEFVQSKHKTDKDLIGKFIVEKIDSAIADNLLPSYQFYENRGINKDVLRYYESGVCTVGEMNNRFVFPIKDPSGEVVALAGRDLLNSDKRPKWKIKGPKTSSSYPVFYNKDIIENTGQIVIIEGISDMVALHNAGIIQNIVLFGTSISESLLSTILTLSVKDIVISLNNEGVNPKTGINPGGDGAKKIIKQLDKFYSNTKLRVVLPIKKDFGEMSKSEIIEWADINNIKRWKID